MTLRDALLSTIVPLSFGRIGYRTRAPSFDARDMAVNLEGVRIGITGGTSGIGLATARVLKGLGGSVTLFGRDEHRGEQAVASLSEHARGEVRFVRCDVGDFRSIEEAALRLGDQPFDRFVHNASILPNTRHVTAEKLEATYATNLVGPLRLEHRLDPARQRLRRVVWVSSGGMYLVPLDLAELRGDVARFDGVRAYAQTKRAQILIARVLSRRFADSGYAAYAMHPGWVNTPSVEEALPVFHKVTRRILRTHAEGADTAAWLMATERSLKAGGFYFDRSLKDFELFPGTRASDADERKLVEMLARDAGVPLASLSTS